MSYPRSRVVIGFFEGSFDFTASVSDDPSESIDADSIDAALEWASARNSVVWVWDQARGP